MQYSTYFFCYNRNCCFFYINKFDYDDVKYEIERKKNFNIFENVTKLFNSLTKSMRNPELNIIILKKSKFHFTIIEIMVEKKDSRSKI